MSDYPPTSAAANHHLFQKNNNQPVDLMQPPETRKPHNKFNNSTLHSKPALLNDRSTHQHSSPRDPDSSSSPIIEQQLLLLRRQISSFKNYDQGESKNSLEAQVFVLKKRRRYPSLYLATCSHPAARNSSRQKKTDLSFQTISLIGKNLKPKTPSSYANSSPPSSSDLGNNPKLINIFNSSPKNIKLLSPPSQKHPNYKSDTYLSPYPEIKRPQKSQKISSQHQ